MKKVYSQRLFMTVMAFVLLVPLIFPATKVLAQSHLDIVKMYYDKRNFDKTIEEANIYLKTDPNNKNVLLELAESYLGKGLNSSAEETVKKALSVDPTFPWAIRVLSRVYRERAEGAKTAAERNKYLNSAKVEAEKALLYAPKDAWVNVEAALVYDAQGNKAMAAKAIAAAASLSPNDPDIKNFQKRIQAKP